MRYEKGKEKNMVAETTQKETDLNGESSVSVIIPVRQEPQNASRLSRLSTSRLLI